MKNKKGFTLVEIIIVLVIITIIAALAGPNIIGWIDHTQSRNCRIVTLNMLDEINFACNEKRFSNEINDYFETVNNSILSVVKFYANNNKLTVKSDGGKFYIETVGICPHSGTDKISWYFDETFDESGSFVVSSTIRVSVKCSLHNDEFTLDTALGIKDTENNNNVLPPSLDTIIELLPNISDLLDDAFNNVHGNPSKTVEAFLEYLSDKIENDPIYSKFFEQANVDAFNSIMSVTNTNQNNIFYQYIINYLFYDILNPQIMFGDTSYPVYVTIPNNITATESWLFYANDGYGGSNTANYANVVCVRSFDNSGTLTAQIWYKYVGSDKYLNLSGGNLKSNDKMASYVKNHPDDFTVIN